MTRRMGILAAGATVAAMVWVMPAAGAEGTSPAAAPSGQASERTQYRIGVGDALEVNVWKNPDVSRNVWVRPDGRITLPLIGEVVAEGQTPQELARTLTDRFKEFLTDPVVTVNLQTINYSLPAKAPDASAPRPEPAPTLGTAHAPYRIGVEDVLDITVWRNPDVSRQVWVRPDGRASLPLVGEFQAEGLTPQELASQLKAGLSAFFADPVVSVNVVEINSYTVYVMGMVRTPGAQKLRAPKTLLQILTVAGGFLEFADTAEVAVLRWEGGKQKRVSVDVKKIVSKGTEADFVVQPGDVIVVP